MVEWAVSPEVLACGAEIPESVAASRAKYVEEWRCCTNKFGDAVPGLNELDFGAPAYLSETPGRAPGYSHVGFDVHGEIAGWRSRDRLGNEVRHYVEDSNEFTIERAYAKGRMVACRVHSPRTSPRWMEEFGGVRRRIDVSYADNTARIMSLGYPSAPQWYEYQLRWGNGLLERIVTDIGIVAFARSPDDLSDASCRAASGIHEAIGAAMSDLQPSDVAYAIGMTYEETPGAGLPPIVGVGFQIAMSEFRRRHLSLVGKLEGEPDKSAEILREAAAAYPEHFLDAPWRVLDLDERLDFVARLSRDAVGAIESINAADWVAGNVDYARRVLDRVVVLLRGSRQVLPWAHDAVPYVADLELSGFPGALRRYMSDVEWRRFCAEWQIQDL